MACVNFINLATARASQRAREVALRKVLGATPDATDRPVPRRIDADRRHRHGPRPRHGRAVPAALSAFLDADLKLSYFGEDGVPLPVIGLLLLVGAAGGLYPAFYLSRFQPAQVLKANKSSAEAAGLRPAAQRPGRRASSPSRSA